MPEKLTPYKKISSAAAATLVCFALSGCPDMSQPIAPPPRKEFGIGCQIPPKREIFSHAVVFERSCKTQDSNGHSEEVEIIDIYPYNNENTFGTFKHTAVGISDTQDYERVTPVSSYCDIVISYNSKRDNIDVNEVCIQPPSSHTSDEPYHPGKSPHHFSQP